jgi:hypothetical protein
MTVTFDVFIRIRRINSHPRAKKVSYNFGIESFLRWHRNLGIKSRFLRMLHTIQNRNSAAGQLEKGITPKPLIVSGPASNCWKDEKVFYNPCN